MLVRPSVAFLIQQTPGTYFATTLIRSLGNLNSATTKLEHRTLSVVPLSLRTNSSFLPVNNNPDPSVPEGGSHWSLLAVDNEHGAALHYDSLNGANEGEARATTQKLASLLRHRITLLRP